MFLHGAPTQRGASHVARTGAALLIGLGGLAFASAAKAGDINKSLSDLTGPWQLFVDDHLIAESEHVTRKYHPLEKHPANPIMVPDRPWEGTNIYVYGTVLPRENGQGYRMWYHALPGDEDFYRLLYAESEEGIHWDKPNLGLVEYKGSTDNNIFIRRDRRDHIPSVIHTPWETSPQRHYAMINYDGAAGGYVAAWSPDGIHWTNASETPVFDQGGDVGQFVWDPHMKRYLGFVKRNADVSGLRRRAVGVIHADSITEWSQPDLVLAPDTFDDRWAKGIQRTSFYGMSAFAYESMYLGFLWVFRADDHETGYFDGIIFIELVTSRDGVNWRRQAGDREPILPVGPSGTWDDGMIFTTQHPLVEGDQIKLYYGGFDCTHAAKPPWHGAIGLATLRKDGFASLDATDATGVVTTKALSGAGGKLLVNYTAPPGGHLKVEVLDAKGKVLPGWDRDACDALEGDRIAEAVTWGRRQTLPSHAPPIRLRFILQNSSIYSFMAGESVRVVDRSDGQHLAVLLTFEDDQGKSVTDKLTRDGPQKVRIHGEEKVDTSGKEAAFGERAFPMEAKWSPWGPLQIEGTRDLGREFTLALMARSKDNRAARLFSSYDDCGPVRTSELIFDCDPKGQTVPGLRLICQGIEVESSPARFDDGAYHHLAVVYDAGNVIFYLDGKETGRGRVPGGEPVVLERNLFVGEDSGHGWDQQFRGMIDDVLVLGKALSAREVAGLARQGAQAVLAQD